MKKIFAFFFVLSSFVSHSQVRSITYPLYGYNSQQAQLYIPAGYNSMNKKAAVIYWHGAGQRGTGNASTLLIQEGLSRYLHEGKDLNMMAVSPQAENLSLIAMSAISRSIDFAIAQGADPNQIYLGGYSYGAINVYTFAKDSAHRIAGLYLVGGSYSPKTSANMDTLVKVPIYLIHGTSDGTQNESNSYILLDSLLNPNHNPVYLPETEFIFGATHTNQDETVFSNFDKVYAPWLLLHDKRIDSTAEYYVDSLETSYDAYLLKRAKTIIEKLSSGAHKTNLESRIADVEEKEFGIGHIRLVLDLGTPSKQSTGNINNITEGASGSSYPNLIDVNGNNTGFTFTTVTQANTTQERDYGLPGGYWNLPGNSFDDAFDVFDKPNASHWRFSNLQDTNLYRILISGSDAASFTDLREQGLIVTINGISDTITNQHRNTRKYIEIENLPPTSGSLSINLSSLVDNGTGVVAFIEFIQQGTLEDPPPITANAGSDFFKAIDQGTRTASFNLTGAAGGGVPSTWLWEKVSGPSMTLTNATSQTATVTNAEEGHYVFTLKVDGGTADTVKAWARDLMKKGIRECRTGPPQTFEVGGTVGGGVTTTMFSMSYITRDNLLPNIKGNDTLVFLANPNNGGTWERFTIGDISGAPGCPINVKFNSVFKVTGPSGPTITNGFFIANSDSNVVSYLNIDGHSLVSQGIKYAMQIGNPDSTTDKPLFRGIAGNLVHNVSIKGFNIDNTNTGLSIKTVADSTNPFTLHDKFRMANNKFTYFRIARSTNEAIYYGSTDPEGAGQGNHAPPIKGDTVIIDKGILDQMGWDNQISRVNYAKVSNLVTYKTATLDASSQNWNFLIGSYVQGRIDSSFLGNSQGGTGFLGMGPNYLTNTIIDSVTYTSSWNSQAVVANIPHPDTLQIFIRGNIFSRQIQAGPRIIMDDNSVLPEWYKPGVIEDNIFMGTGTQFDQVSSEYGDTVRNNTVVSNIDLDTSHLRLLPAYLVYKLMRAAPGTMVSFLDVEGIITPIILPRFGRPRITQF